MSIGQKLDTIEFNKLSEEAVRNITNTALTNFVEITYDKVDSNSIAVNIKVLERWYIWPNLIFELKETNFNSWWENKDFERINYGFSIDDLNFRGKP